MNVRGYLVMRSPLWRTRDFMVFWGGQSLSQIGSRITREGLPLAAVLTLGASPMVMGWMQVVASVPTIIAGLLIGVFLDRFSRRPFLIVTDILRFVVLLIIPITAFVGRFNLSILYITSAAISFLSLIFTAAYESYIPQFVGRSLLIDANTKLSMTDSFAEIVGPGLAGVLIQLFTAPLAVLIDSFTYAISALSIWSIRKTEDKRTNVDSTLDVRRDIRDGVHTIIRNKMLLALTLSAATSALFVGIVFSMDVLYAIRTLHLGAALFGLTVTCGGIGAIIGAAITGPLVRRFGFGKLLLATAILSSLCAWFIPFAHGPVWLATLYLIAAQILGDLFGVIYEVLQGSLRQAVTADDVLGRVNATVNLVISTLQPLGALLGAWIATTYNLRIAMFVGVLGMTVAVVWLFIGPIYQMKELPSVEE